MVNVRLIISSSFRARGPEFGRPENGQTFKALRLSPVVRILPRHRTPSCSIGECGASQCMGRLGLNLGVACPENGLHE